MPAWLVISALLAPAAPQAGAPPTKPIELRGHIRQTEAASELIVEADGLVSECRRVPRIYDNVLPPPDICSSFPVGSRYSAPATYKGRPMRRKVKVSISTYEQNIR